MLVEKVGLNYYVTGDLWKPGAHSAGLNQMAMLCGDLEALIDKGSFISNDVFSYNLEKLQGQLESATFDPDTMVISVRASVFPKCLLWHIADSKWESAQKHGVPLKVHNFELRLNATATQADSGEWMSITPNWVFLDHNYYEK